MQLDRWGRFRLPDDFLKICIKESRDEVFITSTDDGTLMIYHLAARHERVEKLLKERKNDPLLRKFLIRTNYNGQVARADRFGRVQIPGLLRGKIKPEGKLAIERGEDCLELRPRGA